ncbi:MAG: hypothetical protein GXP47_11415 [Acidobacteria bacterium]|nr:hypothetical protein [Acidobacteriota bacterium]
MRYRHLRRTTIATLVAVALVLVLLAVALLVLRGAGVRRRAARWISQRLTASTGATFKVQELQWGLLPPRVDLRGVTIESPSITASVEKLGISGLGLRPARRSLVLGSVTARGVRVVTRFDTMPRRTGHRRWLRVIIRHLDLRDVNFEGTGLPGHLSLTADGLRASWTTGGGVPRGFLDIRELTVRLPRSKPLVLAVRTRFNLGHGAHFPHVDLRGAGVSLAGAASWQGGVLTVDGRGHVDLGVLDDFLVLHGLLQGDVAYTLHLKSNAIPWLRLDLQAPRLSLLGFEALGVDGRIDLDHGRLNGTLRRAQLFGGTISGVYRLDRLGPPFPHSAVLHGRGIDLAALLRWLHVPETGVASSGSIEASLSWNGQRVKAGTGHASVDLARAGGGIPAEGHLDLDVKRDGLIRFSGEGLHIGHSVVSWQGPLTMGSWVPAWSINADPAQISELAALTNALVGTTVLPPELGGEGSLQLTLAGPWHDLQAGIRLEARPLRFPPLTLDHVLISGMIGDGAFRIREATYLLGRGGGRVEGRLAWAGVPDDGQIELKLTGSRLPLSALGRQLGYPDAGGMASFVGHLRGPIASPHGSWALGFLGVQAGPVPLGDGSANLTLDGGVFALQGLRLAGGFGGSLRWEVGRRTIAGDLAWKTLPTAHLGTVAVHMLGPSVGGRLRFTWPLDDVFQGTLALDSPLARLTARIEKRAVAGQLELEGIGTAKVHLGDMAGGGLRGEASVEVSSLAELNKRLLEARGEAFDGSAHASLKIRIPHEGVTTVDGVVDRVDLIIGDTTGHLVRPAQFHLAGRSFSTPGLWLKTAQGDELFARLKLKENGILAGNVSGTASARLFRLVAPRWETAGKVQLVGEISGSLKQPRFDGIAEIQDGSFRLPGSSIVFSSIAGTVLLSPQGIELDGSTFRLMGGEGRAAGWVRMTAAGPDLDLSGTIARGRIEILPGLSPRLNGNWWLRGAGDDLTLGGDLKIARTFLQRKDELSSILMDWFAKAKGGVTATRPRLDIRVEGDRAIDARNAFLRFQTSVFLHITGTPAEPGLVGKVELSEGGEFTFQGVRYDIDSGLITFSDPTRIVPNIDLRLRARVDVYEVWVNLSGTGDRIIPTFASDPPLSQEEIIALLATGHRSSETSSTSSGNLASSILSTSLGEVLDQRARSLLAVDQVRIDPFAQSDAGSPTARVTLVKQLTPSWTIAIESNLGSNREELFFSRWILAPQVYLELTRQRDGSWNIDLRLRKRY